MKQLNKNTKQAQQWIQAYKKATCHSTIEGVYRKPSIEKTHIYLGICQQARENGGTQPIIISFNSFVFTTAYTTADGSALIVDTPSNTYYIEME